ncbi:Peptidoglycan-binding domain protein [Mycena indigotica]|uniref:Peptidoglycan-binding domain protein n=1 Tax=Mycena indigotica TaxID=2126181 RepID=A0A8H6SY51_9AGAR|nr:Peptidoglycan-binding domain protein [Mycena indigotica]KAF7307581.1 Peptidoglycan-binding domain protein [Mycena indigotica]
MGRWSQQDEDSERLPAGMTRIGYDSDTQRYYFRDRNGSVWQGAQGAEFSEMTRVDGPSGYDTNEDLEAAPRRSDGYQPLATDSSARLSPAYSSAYRTLFPFFLLIGVVLLLIWRLILSPGLAAPKNPCPDPETRRYTVEPGDSCWEIAKANGVTLEQLRRANYGLECERLIPGSTMCVPKATLPSDTMKKRAVGVSYRK